MYFSGGGVTDSFMCFAACKCWLLCEFCELIWPEYFLYEDSMRFTNILLLSCLSVCLYCLTLILKAVNLLFHLYDIQLCCN